MPINPQDNDSSKSSSGDELFYLLKSKSNTEAGQRVDGLAAKFFSDEDLAVLQNAVLSQQLNSVEFKPGGAGTIKQVWANYLATGSDSSFSKALGPYSASHTLTWNTNFSGDDATVVREREKAWATAVLSAWNLAPSSWSASLAGAGSETATNGTMTKVTALAGVTWVSGGPNIKVGDALGTSFFAGGADRALPLSRFGAGNTAAFNLDISNIISNTAGGPSLASEEIFDYVTELSTTRSLAFNPGEESYILFKNYYRYFDAETGEQKTSVPFPGNILEAVNKLYAPDQDSALKLMDDQVNTLYDVNQVVKQTLSDFESRMGKIVAGVDIITGYQNIDTQENYKEIPQGEDPLKFTELSYNFSVYDEFVRNMGQTDYGKPYTLLSGIQLNHAMIKDLAFTGLPDTPTGYIGYSGQYLIVSDYETGIHFTGIEKIAQDLIDYGFEVGGGSNYFTGLEDTPTGYIGHSGEYLVVSDYEDGVTFTGIEKIAKDLEEHGLKVIPREFNELPTPALDYNGEIIRVGCALYYSCNGEWEMVSSLGSAAGCVDNLDELSDYEAYKEQFFAEQLANSFIDSFDNNEANNTETQTFEVCLTVNPKGFGHTALIDETGYRFGLFDGIQTVNITATPNNNKAFLRWEGAGATLGDSTSQQTTLLVDKDLFVTGYFEADTNEDPGGGDGSFSSDAIIIKDSFPTSAAPLSGSPTFYSDLQERVVQQGFHYNQRRIDKYGVAYGMGYDTSNYYSRPPGDRIVPYRSLTITPEVSSLHNLSQFHDSGTILIDAIRFRCKRGRRGAGFFGIARLFFVKGTDTYNIDYPQIRSHYSGFDRTKYATSVGDIPVLWAWHTDSDGLRQYQKYIFGYGGLQTSLNFPNNSPLGSQYISDKLFTCADSAAESCFNMDITNPNCLYENIVENDPLGNDSSKTPDTSWTSFQSASGDSVHTYPDQTFAGIINRWANGSQYTQSTVGISGGIDFPAEVYYTFFFKTPMNFTDVMCMCYDVVCDQQEAEVTFEFRRAN